MSLNADSSSVSEMSSIRCFFGFRGVVVVRGVRGTYDVFSDSCVVKVHSVCGEFIHTTMKGLGFCGRTLFENRKTALDI